MNVVGTVSLNGCNYQVGYDLLSQNVSGNYSTVRFYGVLNVTNSYVAWSRGTASVWSASSGLSTRYSQGSYTVVTQDVNISHNSDGTYSGTLSGTLSTTFVSGTASGSFSLPRIPRQASITSAPNFNDEANPTIGYSNPAGNSVSSLQLRIESSSGVVLAAYRDVSKTGSSYTFNLTNAERETMLNVTPNSNTLAVKFVLRTIIGGATYTSVVSRTMTIVNGNPTFSEFTFEDTNVNTLALTGNNKYNINGYSNVKFTIPVENKAEAIKSATMSKYKFFIGTQSIEKIYSNSEDITTILVGATSGTYNVYAIDSRNNSTLVTKFADKEIDYEKPYIDKQSTSVSRNDNQVGTSVNLILNSTFWNNNFGVEDNEIAVSYKFKKTTNSTWITGATTITPTIADNKISFNGEIASDNPSVGWDIDSSYIIKVIIQDKLSTVEYEMILNAGIPTMSYDKNGVGIMCAFDSSKGGYLQVNGKTLEEIIREIIGGS